MPIVNNIRAEFIPVNFEKPAILKQKTIQANGVYNASDDNADGFSSVTVVVPKPAPNLQELNITPSTEYQTIDVPSNVDGFGPVNVYAVTSSIDSNIQPENIIKGKSILGVDGSFYGLRKTIESSSTTKYLSYDTQSTNIIDLTGISGIYYGQLMYAYRGNKSITTADMSYIKYLLPFSLYGTFYECSNLKSINLSSVESISRENACYYMCYNCTSLESFNLNSLQTLSGDRACYRAFYACTSLQQANLPELTTISGASACEDMFRTSGASSANLQALTTITGQSACLRMFYRCTHLGLLNLSSLSTVNAAYAMQSFCEDCTALTTLDLRNLTTINGAYACNTALSGCSNLTSVLLSSLTTISSSNSCAYMFYGCTSLTSMVFDSLSLVSAGYVLSNAFKSCTSLRLLSFPSLTSASFGSYNNQFNNMLLEVDGCTVHFPSNIQTKIGSWADVTNGFGGTNTTVLFDLPATVTLTGANTETYTRNPKYDTATALAWKVGAYGTTNFDPAYYTSGTTDPVVGTTIYSDAECTTAVTTIDSIA